MTTASSDLVTFTATATTSASPERVMDLLLDLRTHLYWGGTRSAQKKFRLLSLDAPEGRLAVGTSFASTGANMNGTFHDSSIVTRVAADALEFQTRSLLDRDHGPDLSLVFDHRYEVAAQGGGARIDYTCRAHDAGYVPYWLKPGVRRLTVRMVGHPMTSHLRQLARIAEAGSVPASAD